MSRTFHNGERRIRVHGVPKVPPDLRRLVRALGELARLEAEAEAERESNAGDRHQKIKPITHRPKSTRPSKTGSGDAA